ncbi:hypothetical protein QE357_001962 [Siphonobacter sp. BAB-5404]|nr:hypothetical protein [Siphonobacter sp. SORGH_AS_0500]
MRHFYLMLLAIPLITVSCMLQRAPQSSSASSYNASAQQNLDYIMHYKLLVTSPVEVYETRQMERRYKDLPAGDTVDVVLPVGVELSPATTEAYYKQYRLFVWGLGTRTKTISSHRYNVKDFEVMFNEPVQSLAPNIYPLHMVVERNRKNAQIAASDSALKASKVAEYVLVVNTPIEAYTSDLSHRYSDIPARDTIRILLNESTQLSPAATRARYKNRDVYVYGAGVRTRTISRKVYVYNDYIKHYRGTPLELYTYATEEVKSQQSTSSSYSPSSSGSSYSSGGTRHSTPTTGAYIHTGPRGGRYYYNSKGNKTYVKRK